MGTENSKNSGEAKNGPPAKTKLTGLAGMRYKHPREPLESISSMKYADHIIFQRSELVPYEHHGIVVDIDTNEGTFDVIEYTGNKTSASAKVECVTHTFSEEEDTMYIVQYKEGECLPDDEVIDKAGKWLNATGYNLLLNNCECMAHACKTGKHRSEQVRNFLTLVVPAAVAEVGGTVVAAVAGFVVFGPIGALAGGLAVIGTSLAATGTTIGVVNVINKTKASAKEKCYVISMSTIDGKKFYRMEIC